MCDFDINTSTVGSCSTYLCLSNSCLILVRNRATGILREYMVWISGAYVLQQSASVVARLLSRPPIISYCIASAFMMRDSSYRS